jgi:hypothetical protein
MVLLLKHALNSPDLELSGTERRVLADMLLHCYVHMVSQSSSSTSTTQQQQQTASAFRCVLMWGWVGICVWCVWVFLHCYVHMVSQSSSSASTTQQQQQTASAFRWVDNKKKRNGRKGWELAV